MATQHPACLPERDSGARFFASDIRVGEAVSLPAEAAHHMRVLRLPPGARVMLLDGTGHIGTGVLERLAKSEACVRVERMDAIAPPPPVHLIVPVADRERMLWLAEKATELGATSWRAVRWRRSVSVSPRGEGEAFERKLRARMVAALTQSAGAWLPQLQSSGGSVQSLGSNGLGLLLDQNGAPILDLLRSPTREPVTLVIGPEGGLEDGEQQALMAVGYQRASLGPTILRFETAGVAALAIVRAALGRTS